MEILNYVGSCFVILIIAELALSVVCNIQKLFKNSLHAEPLFRIDRRSKLL